MKQVFLIIGLLLICAGIANVFLSIQDPAEPNNNTQSGTPTPEPTKKPIQDKVSYEVTKEFDFSIEEFEKITGTITRIKITPDGEHMLVAKLDGEVVVYSKLDGEFKKQDTPFYDLDLNIASQNGLTGIIFGADFGQSGDVFLIYTKPKDGGLINYVLRLSFSINSGVVTGKNAVVIYEGQEKISLNHQQVQGGTGIILQGKSHIIFAVGDGGMPEKAQDLSSELGKILLIQRDGSDPIGLRPYSENVRIQAIGIRNIYDIDINTFDSKKRFAFGHISDKSNDKFVYGNLLDTANLKTSQINFLWDGDDTKQADANPDPYLLGTPNMNIFRWTPSVTPLDLEFTLGGFGSIPSAGSQEIYFIQTLLGDNQNNSSKTGKRLIIGKIYDLDTNPKLSTSDFVVRIAEAEGSPGNPMGLAVDPQNNNIYFADIAEQRIFRLKPQ